MIDIPKCKRISIIGVPASGKSTLAQKLGQKLNLPVYHLDCLAMLPNWVETDKAVFLKQVKAITESDTWITDGNWTATIEDRFKRSDVIIFLNYSREFCIESYKNSRKNNQKRVGVPDYLDEAEDKIDYDSWPEFHNKYPRIVSLVEEYKDKVIEFDSREKLDEFLVCVSKETLS